METQKIEYIDNRGRTRTVILPTTGQVSLGPVRVAAGDVMLVLAQAGCQPRRVK